MQDALNNDNNDEEHLKTVSVSIIRGPVQSKH